MLWAAAGALVVTGCDEAPKPSPEASTPALPAPPAASPAAIAWQGVIEQHAAGSVEWMVGANGQFQARVTDAQGAQIPVSEVQGTVQVQGGEEKKLEAKDQVLSTALPPPEEDVTELEYALNVRGATWTGVIHVPKGGSQALVERPSLKIEPDTRGPNGGIVDVVDDQRIELLIDEESDEVRVYFLDGELEPMPVGDAKMTVALVEAPSSHLTLKLEPEPEKAYLVGKATKKVDTAQRITVVLDRKGKQHARVVGMGAARVVHAGKGAPIQVRVTLPDRAKADDKEVVPASTDDKEKAATGNAKGKVDDSTKGAGVDAKGGVKADPPKVDLPEKAQGKAQGKAGVDVKVP